MKKLYALVVAIAITSIAFAQDWNISSSSFNTLTTISATTTINGLTILSDGSTTVTFDANNKTVDGIDYTYRLKLGGSGVWTDDNTPSSRVLSFPVTGNTTITIVAISSSSSADRSLSVTAGNKTNVIGTASAPGAAPNKAIINYAGGASTIYIYSPSSGVNIYHIKAETVTTGLKNAQLGKVLSTEFFNVTGTKAGSIYEDLNAGIYLQKTTYEDGQVVTSKILKQKR